VLGSGRMNHVVSTLALPEPNTGRPGLVNAFLRGHEQPSLRASANTGVAIGGGSLSPTDGSFDDDTIQYRVRHVNGTAALVNTSVYASAGTAA